MNLVKKIESLIISLLVISLFPLTINADNETSSNTKYSVDSGISIVLPNEYNKYALWNQASEDSTGWRENGFPSFDKMLATIEKDGFELYTYRDDINENSSFRIYIDKYDAPEELNNESLLSYFYNRIENTYGNISDLPVLGYGTVKINDLTMFKVYFQTDNELCDSVYAYLLATNEGKIHEIFFWNHFMEAGMYQLDYLTYSVMSNISFSEELSSNAITLEGGSYDVVRGFHQSSFDFERKDGVQANVINTETVNKTFYQKVISFEFPTWIILVTLILILIFGSKISSKGEWQDNALSLENSRAIQGFCAVAIIIHHLAQDLMDKAGVLSFFSELGVLFVGVFFFFSGYGLYTSLINKKDYLKKFLSRRLVTVLVPLFTCNVIYVVSACMKGQSFSLSDLIVTLTGWILINSHMWFIVEISVLYIAFFVIYSLIKNRKLATWFMGVFVILLTIGSLLLGHGSDMSSKYWFMGEWWYNTTLSFVLGIIVSQNQEQIRNFARKFYVLLLPLFVTLTVAFYYLTKYALNTWSYWYEYQGYHGYKEKLLCLIIQLPWVLFFVITILLIMMKVKFGNKILKFLGRISLELYLIHNLFLTGLRDGSMMSIKSSSVYIVFTILFSICFATIINRFDNSIINLLNNKSEDLVLKKDEDRIHSIDVLRIIMAFLVVTIHIPFKGKTGEIFITYGKIAVPFFLTVCGYFLYRKNSEEMMDRIKKQTVRMLVFYVGSNVLYAIANVLIAHIEGYSVYYTSKQYIDMLLYNMSPFSEHLWFFGSLLYALIILMILNKLKVLNYAMYFAPLLIGIYVVLSHFNVAEAYVLRNVILVGLPYTMMGMLIRRYEDKLTKIKAPVLWIITIILSVTAIIELNTYTQGVGVPFISCEILVYVVVILCLKYPNFGKNSLAERMGIDLSLSIYVLHILVMMFIGYLIPTNVGLISNYGAITVFVITALIAKCYKTIKQLIIKTVNR